MAPIGARGRLVEKHSMAYRHRASSRPPRPRLVSVGLRDPVGADRAKLTCLCQARSSLKKLREDLSSKLENRQGDKQHAQVTGACLGR